MIKEIVMPKMGESITEGTILEWRKKVGDYIALDEILLEIGTDKVDSEIPSSFSGRIVEILAKPNDIIDVGKVIAKIDTKSEAKNLNTENTENTENAENAENDSVDLIETENFDTQNFINKDPLKNIDQKKVFSPVVMKIIAEKGLSLDEVNLINGTGRGGRVTKKDILEYLNVNEPIKVPIEENNTVHQEKKIVNLSSRDEEMSYMRKLISKHMTNSLAISAHVYLMTEVDMTSIVEYVNQNQEAFQVQENFSLTYTPFIIEAAVKALMQFPIMNASLSNSIINYHKNINIGLAVALEDGLMVPSINKCEEKNFLGLCRSVNDVAKRAREDKINANELSGSTFSITNFGVFGVTMGTPIINQPNVGILGIGAVKKQPMVIESNNGDSIGIRSMMMITLGFDHRLVDGSEGSKFINCVKNNLEKKLLKSKF